LTDIKEEFQDATGDTYALQSGASQFETITKLEADVNKIVVQSEQLTGDFNAFKDTTNKTYTDLNSRTNQYQTDTSSKLTTMQDLQNKAVTDINNIGKSIVDVNQQIKTTNDNVTVINGKLVDITGKQQTHLNALQQSVNDLDGQYKSFGEKLTTTQNDIVNKVNSSLTTLTNNVNATFGKQEDRLNNLTNNIDAVGTKFNSFQTDQVKFNAGASTNVNDLVAKTTSLTDGIALVQQRITDTISALSAYMKKEDLQAYAAKADLAAYTTRTELDQYAKETRLADFISRNELSTYVPRREVEPILKTLSDADAALKSLSTTVQTIASNYVTKTDLPKLALDATGVSTLSAALDGTKTSLATLSNNLGALDAKLTNNYYTKTQVDAFNAAFAKNTDLGSFIPRADVESKYYTKTDVDALIKNLNTSLSSVQQSSANLASTVSNLTVTGVLKVNQIKAHTQSYDKQLPAGWGGGVHTWDLYANATIGAGQNGAVNAYMNQGGEVVGRTIKSTGNADAWNWLHVHRNDNDQLFFGGDNTNRGIWSHGNRPVSIYTSGAPRVTVDAAGLTTTKNLNVDGHVNFQNKVFFKDPSLNTSFSAENNTDSYHLEKVNAGNNNSHLRLTINDDPDESFQIWGDACRQGNCNGAGAAGHSFRADGHTWHRDWVDAQNVQGRDHVRAGNDWKAWMRNDGYVYGSSWLDGQNVQGRDHVRAGGDWQTWMRNDGAMHARNRLGVGITPDAAGDWRFFVDGQQGGNAWQTLHRNGPTHVYMAHKDGYGMHINTNNQNGDRYAFQLHNNQRELMTVYNGGEIRWNNRNGNWTHFNYPDGKNYIRNDTNVDGKLTVNADAVVTGRLYTPWDIVGNWIYASGFVQAPVIRGGQWQTLSDKKLKDNISPLTGNLETVRKMAPMSYTLKSDGTQAKGFVAQDLEPVIPESIKQGKDGLKTVDFNAITAINTGAIKEMDERYQKQFPNQERLCLGDVCITKDELLALKNKAK
jgi:hypothetical protein